MVLVFFSRTLIVLGVLGERGSGTVVMDSSQPCHGLERMHCSDHRPT